MATVSLQAIDKLEGLQLLYQRGKSSFIVPSYYLHAVLTFEVSAHYRTTLWDYEWWHKKAKAVTEWEYRWAKDYMHNEHSVDNSLQVVELLTHLMKQWDELVKLLTKKKMNMEPFREWVKNYSKKMDKLLKQLHNV
jgi:hypothetical protein